MLYNEWKNTKIKVSIQINIEKIIYINLYSSKSYKIF